MMHEKVRKELWGYDASEKLSNEELIREKYRGIRPAPGYPACPDHTEKAKLFKLFNVDGKHWRRSYRFFCHVPRCISEWLVLRSS